MQRIVLTTLDEVAVQFGTTTPRRRFLFDKLRQLIQLIEQTGSLKRVYLFGSFVTGKASPNDLDLLVVMDSNFTTATLSGLLLEPFEHERCRIRYSADVFWVTETINQEQIENLLEVFSRDRDKREQPIVELRL